MGFAPTVIQGGYANIHSTWRTERWTMKLLQTIKHRFSGSKSGRFAVLDGIRGFALISMIVYHAVWDLVYIFHFDWDWYRSEYAYLWQQSICWTFILLSGFCQPLGKHQYRRGLTVWMGGAVISLVTYFVMPENLVMFGVLTCLGSCMLLAKLLDPFLRRCKPLPGMLLSLAMFAVTRNLYNGFLGFERWNFCALPEGMYQNHVTAYLGFPPDSFFSTDYFPIIPWFFLFLAGYYLHSIFRQREWMSWLRSSKCGILEWIGRHSLLLYMLHQPVVYGLLTLVMGLLAA